MAVVTDQAVNDTASTNEDTSININVLANDGASGQTKTLYSLSQTGTNVVATATTKLGATVTINADGTVHYDPTSAAAIQALAQGETATDSFLYTLETTPKSGGQSHTSQATVTVNLTGVNDPPVIHDSTPPGPQATTDNNPVHPFSAVSVTDVDHNAQDSATITLSNSANGILSGTGVSATNTPGVYTIAATSPGTLTSDLQGLSFTPATPPAVGSTTTNFSLSVSDGIAPAVSDNTISVADTASYKPSGYSYNPDLQSSNGAFFGGGMPISASTSGVLEFDVSDISATIASHPITSATLSLQDIEFGQQSTTDPSSFDVNIYAFNGTGSLTTDLSETGTLVGTTEVGYDAAIAPPVTVSLNASALNQVLSHGSDLGFALVAQNPGSSFAYLDTGTIGNGFQLHLTA